MFFCNKIDSAELSFRTMMGQQPLNIGSTRRSQLNPPSPIFLDSEMSIQHAVRLIRRGVGPSELFISRLDITNKPVLLQLLKEKAQAIEQGLSLITESVRE